MNTNIAQTYRQLAAQGASLVSLVIQCYDEIIASLHSAIDAIEKRDIEKKAQAVKRAGTFIAYLRSILDFERGGDTALYLDRFYVLAQTKMLESSFKLAPGMLRELAQEFSAVRDAWQHAQAPGTAAPRNPSVSSHPSFADDPAPARSGWSA